MRKLTKWGLSLLAAGLAVMALAAGLFGTQVTTLTSFQFPADPYHDMTRQYRTDQKVTSLVLDMEAGDVTIRSGDHFSIRTHGLKEANTGDEDGYFTSFDVSDGRALFVTRHPDTMVNLGSGTQAQVEIILPASVKEADLNLSMGGLALADISLDTAQITLNMGSLSYAGTIGSRLKAEVQMGDADIELRQPEPALDLSVDMGSLEINGEEIEGEFGSSKFTETRLARDAAVEAEVKMGDLTVRFAKAG